MKKAWYILFVLAAIIISITIWLFYPHKVNHELVRKVYCPIKGINHDANFGIITNSKSLNSILSVGPIMKSYKNIINENDFNFEEYNYLICYGTEIKSLDYNWYFVYFVESCGNGEEKKGIPIRANYISQNRGEYISIYRLPKKPMYRNICG